MRFLSLVGNSFGCSASGERLVSAARDGDLQEAKALLEYNPRLARYSTFGVRNSPLHYSAAQGHNEIVSLLLESGVDINLRNYRGQTALMQASQHGHWEVVQTMILFKANIHKADYLNGGTALHLAALNGHSRCIRLLLTDYIPSSPKVWDILTRTRNEDDENDDDDDNVDDEDPNNSEFDKGALNEIISRAADGGITALHMAALNGHVETLQLFLDFGASVSKVTVGDGTTIDLIGAGSTPLHYAACGGNAQCCQILIAWGASLTAENANGWTPLMVSRSWHRDWLDQILSPRPQPGPPQLLPSPFLSLPLSSMVKIARECGWRSDFACVVDPCVVCLERKCTVAAQGCDHEFCTQCALYLCSTNNTTSTAANGPPGSIACPLCRHGIVSFAKLISTRPLQKESTTRTTLSSLSLCTCSTTSTDQIPGELLETSPLCSTHSFQCTRIPPLGSSFRSSNCHPSLKFSPGLCVGGADSTSPSLVRRNNVDDREFQNQLARLRRSASQTDQSSRRWSSSWFCSLNQYVATGSGCS